MMPINMISSQRLGDTASAPLYKPTVEKLTGVAAIAATVTELEVTGNLKFYMIYHANHHDSMTFTMQTVTITTR